MLSTTLEAPKAFTSLCCLQVHVTVMMAGKETYAMKVNNIIYILYTCTWKYMHSTLTRRRKERVATQTFEMYMYMLYTCFSNTLCTLYVTQGTP